MQRVWIGLGMFLLAVVAISAALSPPAFWLCDNFAEIPFRRVFNRMVMVSALLALGPLAWWWGVASWKKLGLREEEWLRRVFFGFGFGLLTMAALFAAQLLCGVRIFSWDLSAWKAGEFLLSALAIGFLEELLFRGLLFYALRDLAGKQLAGWAVLNATFFATVHFIKAKNIAEPVTWLSGWQTWANAWPTWEQIPGLLPRWLSLFLVGLILCAVVWRWGSLWLAMGLHAGWVFLLKAGQKMTELHSQENFFWFGADVVTGFGSTAFLLVMLAVLLWVFPQNRFSRR